MFSSRDPEFIRERLGAEAYQRMQRTREKHTRTVRGRSAAGSPVVMMADVRDGAAVWVCLHPGHVIAPIGALTG